MKNKFSFWFAAFCLLLSAQHAPADSEKWELDRAHSNVYFDIRHTYATVRGQFDEFSGAVRFDPENLPASTVILEVDTASVNTGIPNRDNHLRSEEFFAVKDYPSMSFQSTAVRAKEGGQYILEGRLTIKGRTREIAIPFTYFGMRENPLKKGQMVAGFETRFSINRLEYGVGTGKYLKMGVIGDTVDILITLEVVKSK